MQRFPYELLERVCSLLDTENIWALTQVSSHLRLSAVFPLLSRFGISESDVRSGTISLSHSFFLIPLISRVQPIRKLICFERDEGGRHRYEDLIAVLSATAPIPDILIHDRCALSKHPPRATNLLWCLPQTGHSTLLLVKHGSIGMSRPRTGIAPLRWRVTPRTWCHQVSPICSRRPSAPPYAFPLSHISFLASSTLEFYSHGFADALSDIWTSGRGLKMPYAHCIQDTGCAWMLPFAFKRWPRIREIIRW